MKTQRSTKEDDSIMFVLLLPSALLYLACDFRPVRVSVLPLWLPVQRIALLHLEGHSHLAFLFCRC